MILIIFVGSARTKSGPRDRTEKIFLVGSPRVSGYFVGSWLPNLGGGDRTAQPLTPGDRTKKFFLVGSLDTNLGGGDRTEIQKCVGSRHFYFVFRRISGVENANFGEPNLHSSCLLITMHVPVAPWATEVY